MKHIVLCTVIALAFSSALHAEEMDSKHPCHNIKTACEAAGFVKGQHKQGKGLWKDCMDKLAKGEAVPGVAAEKTEVEACKAKHMEHKAHQKK
jgi:hypothetical protein